MLSISMNIEIPPAQDSPKHILNVLNDDCIQLIFRRLENVQDFLSAAETCTRFQANAKLIFRLQYTKIRIGKLYDDPSKKRLMSQNRYTVTVDRAQSILSVFGYLITKLDFNMEATNQKLNDDIQNMIADYCGKTLNTFMVGTRDLMEQPITINFNTRSPLQALTELEILNVNVHNFQYHSQLRSLLVKGTFLTGFDWLIQAFPKLEIVKFECLHKLQYNQGVRFLKLNPQLKSLKIEYCKKITPYFIKHIVNLTPNLEMLFFRSTYHRYSNEHMIYASQLRNLKTLFISSFRKIPAKQLINSLIENMVPIEVLGISNEKYHAISQLNISQFKLLKKLYFKQMSDEILINFVNDLPALEEIIASQSPKITLKGIQRALQCSKQLSVLIVDTYEMTIDLDDFKLIANLAKLCGVKVTINIKNGTIDIPNDFLKANRKWLKVNIANLPWSARVYINSFVD